MAGRLKKIVKRATLTSLIIGALLSPFRGDFSPKIGNLDKSNIPISSKYVIGHRAGVENYHENSLEAISDFGETGADIAEIDVMKTKDGVFVINHDPKIEGKSISTISYETAKSLARKRGYTLARLDEALKIISKQNRKVLADLKIRGDEEAIVSLMKKYLPADKIYVASKSPDSLIKVKKTDRGVKTSLIMDGFPYYTDFIRRNTGIIPWREIKYCDPDFVSVRDDMTTNDFYENASKHGIKVLPYNVFGEERIKELLKYKGVGGIIVDKPREAMKDRRELIKDSSSLEKRSLEYIAGAAIFFLFLSIIFSYVRITGNVILTGINKIDLIGIFFFLAGLFYAYFYLKFRSK